MDGDQVAVYAQRSAMDRNSIIFMLFLYRRRDQILVLQSLL
jgi:hypothetical protein